jgi:hypothetical protein
LPYAQPNYWTHLYNVSVARDLTDDRSRNIIFIGCNSFNTDQFCAGGDANGPSALCSDGYEGYAW